MSLRITFQELIREGTKEYLARKSWPADELLAELESEEKMNSNTRRAHFYPRYGRISDGIGRSVFRFKGASPGYALLHVSEHSGKRKAW